LADIRTGKVIEMAWNPDFEVAFRPRTVAVVGATRKPVLFGDFVGTLVQAGFPGQIYPINPRAAEAGESIHGYRAYASLREVPERIDLVTASVPAKDIIPMLEDCTAVDAKNIQIYTAGFRESGTEEGERLESELQRVARKGGLRIVGPNCMGLHVPAARCTTWPTLEAPGPVGFIAQSGGHAGVFIVEAANYGINVSKVISFGNAAVMDSTDFLEYMAGDPETEIICMYLEGVKDGPKLTSLVREINREKPVIIWKGGATDSGARAAASHTGSLGGEREVWDAFFRQTGALRVDCMEELLNAAMTFRYLRPLAGRRMALILGGGGNSVAAADVCDRAGLEVPHFSEETKREMASFIPPEGTILRNPIDIAFAMVDLNLLMRAIEASAADPSIDAVIFALPPGAILIAANMLQAQEGGTFEEALERQTRLVIDSLAYFNRANEHGKPLVIVLHPGLVRFLPGQKDRLLQELLGKGVPVYLSIEQASLAIGRFVRYHEFHGKA